MAKKWQRKNIEYQQKIPMIGNTVEELELYFESKQKNILARWEWLGYTNDTGPL